MSSWNNPKLEKITIPVLIAAAGAVLLFASTFLEIGNIRVLGFSASFHANDFGLETEVMIIRLVSLAACALVLIRQVPNILYSFCVLMMYVSAGLKIIRGLGYVSDARQLMQAVGLSSYIDLSQYVKLSAGYYLFWAGAVTMLCISVVFLIEFFRDLINDRRLV